jgi:H+-translocating NAD(P) transhydrogenase subunit beta
MIGISGFVGLYIFMLAAFAGWIIIGRVPAILHTPLMSGSNFVHGIVVVGGILILLNASTITEQIIGFVAVLLGAGNAAGGYAVTDRMLAMFQTSSQPAKHARRHHAKKGSAYVDAHSPIHHWHRRSRSGFFVALRPASHVIVLVSFLDIFGVSAAAKPLLPVNIGLAVIAVVMGGGVAWWAGKKVAMTAMPQMVAVYNGMGGGAAGAIAAVELFGRHATDVTPLVVTLLGALIGAVSFSGSMIAWAKLQSILDNPLRFPGQKIVSAGVFVGTLVLGGYIVFLDRTGTVPPSLTYIFFGCAMLFGILMTLPIGGADMPVVISIYNAFTGLAVGLEGFVLQNPALMIAGMVVGAAGLMLTLLMAKAMNRSVSNVLFSNFGDAPKHKQSDMKGSLKPTEASDAGIFMHYAEKVIIVPGYGLAAAQGQ